MGMHCYHHMFVCLPVTCVSYPSSWSEIKETQSSNLVEMFPVKCNRHTPFLSEWRYRCQRVKGQGHEFSVSVSICLSVRDLFKKRKASKWSNFVYFPCCISRSRCKNGCFTTNAYTTLCCPVFHVSRPTGWAKKVSPYWSVNKSY